MKNLAIFVSGSGSNAENIFNYFVNSDLCRIALIVSDNANAYALERASRLGIESIVIPRPEFRDGEKVTGILNGYGIDYIVLAGFLSLVPSDLVKAFSGHIINIHPALLPAYGGKGMYGDNVHKAVIANREQESGITIHHVNEKYDEGSIIAQYKVAISPEDTPETLAEKIHALEYEYFPKVIESEIKKLP